MDYISTTQDYWISPQALYIELNALGSPDYIQAGCVSGAQILVYIKDIIGYDAGHNYRRWALQASPTFFNTHTAKYVYVAVPRSATVSLATLVFPSEVLDVYGMNDKGEQIGSADYYYISLHGVISSSGDNGTINREWTERINTGFLSSDEAISAGAKESEWYTYSMVDQITTFLKNITMKAGTKFLSLFAQMLTIVTGGTLSFEAGGSVRRVADSDSNISADDEIATPKYVDDSALSKRHDDKTEYSIELANLRANGSIDVFGNLTVGSADAHSDIAVHGGIHTANFNKGVEGADIDFYGNAEFESIVARSFLEVPELRYNRTTITVGNKWQTVGAGIIEEVWGQEPINPILPDEGDDDIMPSFSPSGVEGIAKLKLEDGEIGAIAIGDKCQGVFHFTDKANDTEDIDTKDGNFHFAGFTTIYFEITDIYTAETLPPFLQARLAELGETPKENQYFQYVLRAATCADLPPTDRNRWTDASHPQPSMHFACYANAYDADRQASRLTTTTYQLHLAGMTDWTYTQDNIRLIIGWLDGFSLLQQVWDRVQKRFVETTKELHGEGIATGNIYMWGNIDQFDRAPSLINQQIYYKATNSKASPEGIIVSPTHESYSLNGWQKSVIIPDDNNTYVWQQCLYLYSDDTYVVGEISICTTPGLEGQKGDKGDPGTSINLKGSAIKYFEAYGDYERAEKRTGLYLVYGKQESSGGYPVSIRGAYIYSYDADRGTTDISISSSDDTYICEDNGHLYMSVNTSTGGLYNPKNSSWVDMGLIRGKDATLFTLDIPAAIIEGCTSFPITVVKTEGTTVSRLTYAQATAEVITIEGTEVQWTADYQRFYLPSGAVKDTVYTIRLMWHGYLIQEYSIPCVGNGNPGYDGCIVRRSEWAEGVLYHNDQNLTPEEVALLFGDTTRYIDEVSVTDFATGDSRWYIATEAHSGVRSSNDNKPSIGGSNQWWTMANELKPLRTSFADISTALIDFLQARQIVVTDNEGNPYGAFGGGNEWPLWFGGLSPEQARVRFHRTGYTEYMGNDNKPNIRIGTDSDGYAVLKFYDSAGNERYNLGYMGLKEIIATAMQDHYDPFASNLHFVAIDTTALTPPGCNIKTILAASQQTFYRFLCSYFIDASGKKVKAGDYIAYDERIYEHQDRMPPQNTLVNGTYAFFGKQPVQTPSGLNKYVIHLYKVVNGTLSDYNQWTRYYDYDSQGNPVLYDDQGSTPRASQTLYARDFG